MFHFFALNCPIFRERVDEVNAEGASELVLRDRIAFRYLSGQPNTELGATEVNLHAAR